MNFADPFAHGSYLVWDGGSLKFDTCDEEDVEHPADVVEHPVEVGVNVTDHYRPKSRTIKLTAFISQEPIDPSIYPDAGGSLQTVELSLPAYPQMSAALEAATGAFASALAKSPPTSFTQRVLTYQNAYDTLAGVLSTILDDLRANATLIDVATKSRYYAQHLLANVAVKRNEKTGTGAIVELELQQVSFVSTNAVAAPPTPVKKKDKPSTNKGKQNPTPPLKSFAVQLGQGLGVLSSPSSTWYGPTASLL